MRLLNVKSFKLVEFHNDNDRPPYAIASHRWTSREATFADVRDQQNTNTSGYRKVEAFATYVKANLPAVEWLWIDTCCINKDSAAELSEAINLMFEWYLKAEVCIAYLADVEKVDDESSFLRSEWFERGWTLQEMLAPRTVLFLTSTWEVIGNKGGSTQSSLGMHLGRSLEQEITGITSVPVAVLRDYKASIGFTVREKLAWMANRKTTKEEDMSYALYGIFNVSLGANYGEKERAKDRLLAAIHQRERMASEEAERFHKVSTWLSPSNPWDNHQAARKQHEPETGAWLLKTDLYQAWKSGEVQHLWIHGKAGSGKTILCSTAIEDIQTHCRTLPNVGQALFYFSFSDQLKQTYESLLRSMVVQLGCKEPGLSLLYQAHDRREQKTLGVDELYQTLLTSVTPYDAIFLHLDGLDECSAKEETRLHILPSIRQLLQGIPKIRMIATSRDYPDIRSRMEEMSAKSMSMDAQAVDSDIRKYILTQLAEDSKLRQLPDPTQKLIEDTLAQKAQGMFRWAYCQLQELKNSKSTKPKSIRAALLALPDSLDETYLRMLMAIPQQDCSDALVLLRWITYAKSPLTLKELVEVTLIELGDGAATEDLVDLTNRGGWRDTLAILAGLVTILDNDEDSDDEDSDDKDPDGEDPDDEDPDGVDSSLAQTDSSLLEDTKVILAHFSVREYLESSRITTSDANMFYLNPLREHRFLAHSCLVYLHHYSNSSEKRASKQDLAIFPLLEYASKNWFHHSRLQRQEENRTRELSFLMSDSTTSDWLRVYQPEHPWRPPFPENVRIQPESSLYYASVLGLKEVAKLLIQRGADVNKVRRFRGNPLQAASRAGHIDIAKLLLDHGADVNVRGECDNALQAASRAGHIDIAKLLLDHGADVNARGERDNALVLASIFGHIEMAKLLLKHGAEVNARAGDISPIAAASYNGRIEIVKLLLKHGANPRVGYGSKYCNPLHTTSLAGHTRSRSCSWTVVRTSMQEEANTATYLPLH